MISRLIKSILTTIILLLMFTPAHCESKLTWSLDGQHSTPYLVDKDYLSGEKKVFNLRTGEMGMEIKGFGTIQTGRRTDETMEMILRENPEDEQGEED